MSKRGRPPKPREKKMLTRSIAMLPEVWEAVRRKAEEARVPVATWVRLVIEDAVEGKTTKTTYKRYKAGIGIPR